MKKCVFVALFAGVLGLLMPERALAATPNGRLTHTPRAAHSTVRKSPKLPRRDQVHRSNLDGSITLIQIISTRRSQDDRRQQRITPLDSAAQVLASSAKAERDARAVLTARSVDSLPPHWGATHLCI